MYVEKNLGSPRLVKIYMFRLITIVECSFSPYLWSFHSENSCGASILIIFAEKCVNKIPDMLTEVKIADMF